MNHLAILEKDLEFSRMLLNELLECNKRIRLVNLAIHAKEIMKLAGELGRGDILILDFDDLEVEGQEVMEYFRQSEKIRPYIIAISNHPKTEEKMEEYLPYISKYIQKPFALKNIIETIEKITYETSIHNYEKMAKKELHRFDLNPTTKGYAYIVEAITLSLDDDTLLEDMSNGLYKKVAIQKDVSVNKVKWGIEKTLHSILRYTKSSIIESYFYVVAGEKVTPKMFISTIVDNLKEEFEQKSEEYV